MRRPDRFDIMMVTVALAALVSLAVTVASSPVSHDPGKERSSLVTARLLYLQSTFGPVEEKIRQGRWEEAGMLLQELSRSYPDEPYLLLLKGRILAARGAVSEAIASYAGAVRRDGALVDERGVFSARREIERVVAAVDRTALSPGPRRDFDYLRSRLAGGCE